MRRVLLLAVLLSGCAAKTAPQAQAPDPDRLKVYSLPPDARGRDRICLDANFPGTCATVADVRAFLRSRKS